jgi:hypothetical protein
MPKFSSYLPKSKKIRILVWQNFGKVTGLVKFWQSDFALLFFIYSLPLPFFLHRPLLKFIIENLIKIIINNQNLIKRSKIYSNLIVLINFNQKFNKIGQFFFSNRNFNQNLYIDISSVLWEI